MRSDHLDLAWVAWRRADKGFWVAHHLGMPWALLTQSSLASQEPCPPLIIMVLLKVPRTGSEQLPLQMVN